MLQIRWPCQKVLLSSMSRLDLVTYAVSHNQHGHSVSRRQKRAVQMWTTCSQGQRIAQTLCYLLTLNSHNCIYGEKWERDRSRLMHLDCCKSCQAAWMVPGCSGSSQVDQSKTKQLQIWPAPNHGFHGCGTVRARWLSDHRSHSDPLFFLFISDGHSQCVLFPRSHCRSVT